MQVVTLINCWIKTINIDFEDLQSLVEVFVICFWLILDFLVISFRLGFQAIQVIHFQKHLRFIISQVDKMMEEAASIYYY